MGKSTWLSWVKAYANNKDAGHRAHPPSLNRDFVDHYSFLERFHSFRTQVISYPGHFVPFWSFRTHFYFHFGHFVPSLVISYPVWSFRTYFLYFYLKLVWSFRTQFLHFHTQVISYLESFRTQFSHFVPRSFRT